MFYKITDFFILKKEGLDNNFELYTLSFVQNGYKYLLKIAFAYKVLKEESGTKSEEKELIAYFENNNWLNDKDIFILKAEEYIRR